MLMLACQYGHDLCAHALLEAGADRTKAVDGWTALMLAQDIGHESICKLFEAI